MNEPQPDGQAAAEPVAPVQTMESLAAAIPAEPEGVTPPQQVEPVAPVQPNNVDDFNKFVQTQTAENEQLKQKLEAVTANQGELEASIHREAVNKAVDSAVQAINDNVGGDPEMAEFFLSKAYNNDPNLQKIFNNREQFPEQYQAALGVLNTEWAAKQSVTIDPQVAENQRALKESQKSGSTPQVVTKEEEMENMNDAEFFAMGQSMANNN